MAVASQTWHPCSFKCREWDACPSALISASAIAIPPQAMIFLSSRSAAFYVRSCAIVHTVKRYARPQSENVDARTICDCLCKVYDSHMRRFRFLGEIRHLRVIPFPALSLV